MFCLKDAEIARLQARISGLERTMTSNRAIESFNHSFIGNQSVYQSSGIEHGPGEVRNSAEFLRTRSDFIPSKDGHSGKYVIENGHFQHGDDQNGDFGTNKVIPESSDEVIDRVVETVTDRVYVSGNHVVHERSEQTNKGPKVSVRKGKNGKFYKGARTSDHLPGEQIIGKYCY